MTPSLPISKQAAQAQAACGTTIEARHNALSLELAATVRVRNRLAHSPDSSLPHVLTGLLPRLFNLLEKNAVALLNSNIDDDEVERDIRQQTEQQVLGILIHCSERVRNCLNNSNATACSVDVVGWIEAVVVNLHTYESAVTLTVALSLVETAFPLLQRQQDATTAKVSNIIVPRLMEFLNVQHRLLATTAESYKESRRGHVRTAGWLLLHSIAFLHGMIIVADWDMMQDYNSNTNQNHDGSPLSLSSLWEMLEKAPGPSPAALQAARKDDGAGVFDLALDVLLFWPATTAEAATASNNSGLSPDGRNRLNHKRRGAAWDHLYLRQLKYVVLRHAIGTTVRGTAAARTKCQGLFSGDRGLLLAVLGHTGESMHGRLAVNVLNAVHGSEGLVRKAERWQRSSYSCSLSLAVSLLVLMLGDAAAAPVLQEYQSTTTTAAATSSSSGVAHLWEAILGPRPTESALQRSPLPVQIASRAAQFLLDHFRPNIVGGEGGKQQREQGLRIFLDLVVVLQHPSRHGVYWGIQLMHNLLREMKKAPGASSATTRNSGGGGIDETSEWVKLFYKRCLSTSKAVLLSVPEASSGGEFPMAGQAPGDLPAGMPMPFGRRRDLDALLRNSRTRQKRERWQLTDACNARQAAYEMIKEFSNESYLEEDCETKLLFELPIILLQCASVENETMQMFLTRALESLLASYKRLGAARRSIAGATSLEHQVAALLPALVSTACADSPAARLVVARWATGFLWEMDPTATLHICSFLAGDSDMFVSAQAKKCGVEAISIDAEMDGSSLVFLNRGDVSVSNSLQARVTKLSNEGRVSKNIAGLILYDHGFLIDEALAALQDEMLPSTMAASGLLLRYNNETYGKQRRESPLSLETCAICYDDEVEVFRLGCGHSFCCGCWLSFLDESLCILKTTCPQHECSERLTLEDIEHIRPNLVQSWNDAYLMAFIEKDTEYRNCTGPDCQMVAFLRRDAHRRATTSCHCESCNTSFCFQCGDVPHEPAKCEDSHEWNRIFVSSSFWVKKNSKPCPECKAPIQKNNGCDHMTCRCGTEFCWICLKLLNVHQEAHTCNRYDPVDGAENDEERRALHYTDRFSAHDDAQQFAQDELKVLDERCQTIADRLRFFDDGDFDILQTSSRELVDAKRFLKWSYVAAWKAQNPKKLDLLTMTQATLELVTERLNQMNRKNLEHLYQVDGERAVKSFLRSMEFLCKSVSGYKERILKLAAE